MGAIYFQNISNWDSSVINVINNSEKWMQQLMSQDQATHFLLQLEYIDDLSCR